MNRKGVSIKQAGFVLGALGLLVPAPAPAQEPANPPPQTQPTTAPAPPDELGLAEDEDVGLLELEMPLVVTATRREQSVTTLPYAISIITAEDIRRSGAGSIPDALRLASGVDVAHLTFNNYAVSPRGFHGAVTGKVLVLVDGRQIFDSVFGGTLWGSWPFQLEDIERIEVIRGPAGVTWGANTVNGVINIITKDPRDQTGVTFTGGGGSRGTHKEHLGYAFADEKLRFRISGEYEASDGFHRGGSLLRNLEDDCKGGRMALHAVYEARPDDTLTISAGSAVTDGGYPPIPMAVFDRRRNPGSQANFVLGKWSHRVDSTNDFELTAYVNDFRISPGVAAIDYRYQQAALQFSQTIQPGDAHILTWGIDSRVDLADAADADPFMLSKDFVSTAIVGLYAQDQWKFAPRWTFDLGGRIDYEFYGGFQPSGRASLAYELSDSTFLYGAVSRAFQLPAAADRFLDVPMLGGLVHMTCPQDLDAQPLIAYELGYRGRFLDRLQVSLNFFWNEHDHLVAFRPRLGPPGLMQLRLDAPAAATIYGVELETRYAVNPQLTLVGHYTYQQFDWRASLPLNASDYIAPPDHKFMIGARYSPTDDLHLSGHLYYVSTVRAPNPAVPFLGRYVSPYFRLDLRAEHEFWNDQASISVGVRNLLDPHHYEGGTTFLNDAEVPRMVYAELRVAVK
jgi:iron complex outermembrane receptor protein